MNLEFLNAYKHKIIYTINYKYKECFISSNDYRYQIFIDIGKCNDKTSIMTFKTNDNGMPEIVNTKTLPNNDIDNLKYIIEGIIKSHIF